MVQRLTKQLISLAIRGLTNVYIVLLSARRCSGRLTSSFVFQLLATHPRSTGRDEKITQISKISVQNVLKYVVLLDRNRDNNNTVMGSILIQTTHFLLS